MLSPVLALSATLIFGSWAAPSNPLDFVSQESTASSCGWESEVTVDAQTGEILETKDRTQWQSTVLLEVETGKVLSENVTCNFERVAPAAPSIQTKSPNWMNLFQ